MSIYTLNGYKDRADYLRVISNEFGTPLHTAMRLANDLWPNEDFDALVKALYDYDEMSPEEFDEHG